jgi:hypothetical protein
VDAD